jgi:AcrR family transcriptional regulator
VVLLPERADARANRRRILEAALGVLSERGAAAEVKEIAERAGVGVGTIYRNFATRDDLFRAIVEELIGRFYAVRDEALVVDDPIEAVSRYVSGMFELLEQYSPAIMALIAGFLTEEMKERFLQYARGKELESVLRRGIERGVFRADLPIGLARGLLVNACDPVVYLALQDSAPRDEIATGYTDLILRALRA